MVSRIINEIFLAFFVKENGLCIRNPLELLIFEESITYQEGKENIGI